MQGSALVHADELFQDLVQRHLACPESNQEPVFRLPTYSRALWKYLLRKDLEDAGLSLTNSNGDKLGWKSFRKFYATELSRRGLSVPSIQRAIGHASARTTERYLDPSRDLDRRACFSVLEPSGDRAPNRALLGGSEPPEPPSRLDTTALDATISVLPCVSGRQLGAVAQLVRAPDCLSGGCEFESRPPRFWKPSYLRRAFSLGWFWVESEESARFGARFWSLTDTRPSC